MLQNNQVASIEYELKDIKTGDILDSNKGNSPLEFIVGAKSIIPGLENEIKGYEKGQNGKVQVSAKDAYGEYNEEAKEVLPKEQFEGIELTEGLTLYGQTEDGNSIPAKVLEFDEKEVTIDYNHPLAGKDLEFDVTLLDVRDASEDEISSGQIKKDGCCNSGGCGCN